MDEATDQLELRGKSRVARRAMNLIQGVAGLARRLMRVTGFFWILGLVGYAGVMGYFGFMMDVAWGWMFLPGVLMGLPLLGVGGFVYVLYCLANLPGSVEEGVVGSLAIKGRHRERLERLERKRGFLPKFKRLRLMGGLLWDVLWNAQHHGDTYGDIQMGLWMLMPWFWMVVGVSCVTTVVTQAGFLLFCAAHWVF